MAHQPRDVMAGLEAWRGSGHMDAMCSARARALVQYLTRRSVENREKCGKIGEKYRMPVANP